MEIEIPNDFIEALIGRLGILRPRVEINPKNQTVGYRFKNDDINIEAIVGAVIVANQSPRPPGIPILPNAIGLNFQQVEILSGRYDSLICTTLYNMSVLDYVGEHRIDFN